mgnify:CR=1 FL=1
MRYQLYERVDTIDEDIEVFDLFSVDWSNFSFDNGFKRYRINEQETIKTYMISYNNYGTTKYDDILLLINNVSDPTDLKANSVFYIPRKGDIQKFIERNS